MAPEVKPGLLHRLHSIGQLACQAVRHIVDSYHKKALNGESVQGQTGFTRYCGYGQPPLPGQYIVAVRRGNEADGRSLSGRQTQQDTFPVIHQHVD